MGSGWGALLFKSASSLSPGGSSPRGTCSMTLRQSGSMVTTPWFRVRRGHIKIVYVPVNGFSYHLVGGILTGVHYHNAAETRGGEISVMLLVSTGRPRAKNSNVIFYARMEPVSREQRQ